MENEISCMFYLNIFPKIDLHNENLRWVLHDMELLDAELVVVVRAYIDNQNYVYHLHH